MKYEILLPRKPSNIILEHSHKMLINAQQQVLDCIPSGEIAIKKLPQYENKKYTSIKNSNGACTLELAGSIVHTLKQQ